MVTGDCPVNIKTAVATLVAPLLTSWSATIVPVIFPKRHVLADFNYIIYL
jgi:hypothetical protein